MRHRQPSESFAQWDFRHGPGQAAYQSKDAPAGRWGIHGGPGQAAQQTGSTYAYAPAIGNANVDDWERLPGKGVVTPTAQARQEQPPPQWQRSPAPATAASAATAGAPNGPSQADEVMLGRQVTRTTRSESESTWGFRHGSGRYVPLSSGGA